MSIAAIADVKRAVHDTLRRASMSKIDIKKINFNERRTAAHVNLTFGRDRLFAKVLLAPTYLKLSPQFILASGYDDGHTWQAAAQIRQEQQQGHLLREIANTTNTVSVPRMVEASERHQALVWEHVDGVNLDELLKRPYGQLLPTISPRQLAALVGSFLRAVHDRHPVAPGSLQLADCTPLIERARKLTPEWSDVLENAVARLQQQFAAQGMADGPATLIHGDLSLSNLLWDDRRRVLHVVDFEHSRSDSVLFDLAAWIYGVRVALFRPLVQRRTVRDWESGFREGYQLASSAAQTAYAIAELVAVIWIFGYFLPQRIRERETGAHHVERLRRLIYRRILMKPLLRRRLGLLQQTTEIPPNNVSMRVS